jgi:hypothetical protein
LPRLLHQCLEPTDFGRQIGLDVCRILTEHPTPQRLRPGLPRGAIQMSIAWLPSNPLRAAPVYCIVKCATKFDAELEVPDAANRRAQGAPAFDAAARS